MLDFEKNQQPVLTASAVQVREPLHGNSIGKWRRYATQLAPLRTALAASGLTPDR
jgi:ABC-type nitrate/sulfonate/bicarbonate transport system substrate-binding protein